MLQAEMPEVIAGVDDDRQTHRAPAPAPGHARAWRRRRRRTEQPRGRSSEQILPGGRISAAAGWWGARDAGPAPEPRGEPRRLPHEYRGRRGDLIGVTDDGDAQRATEQIRSDRAGPASPANPAQPIATPTVPTRQGRPKLSLIMMPGAQPVDARSRSRRRAALASGSSRQQQRKLPVGGTGDIGLIDARVGHDEAQAMLDDQHILRGPDDAPRFAQISSTSRGSFCTVCASSSAAASAATVGQIDPPPLGLGDDFLREHQHIAGAQPRARRAPAPPRSSAARSSPARHLRKVRQGDESQFDAEHSSCRIARRRVQPNAARSRGRT